MLTSLDVPRHAQPDFDRPKTCPVRPRQVQADPDKSRHVLTGSDRFRQVQTGPEVQARPDKWRHVWRGPARAGITNLGVLCVFSVTPEHIMRSVWASSRIPSGPWLEIERSTSKQQKPKSIYCRRNVFNT